MQTIPTITETKHQELLTLLNPLVDFMIANDFSYFLVAGKDGTCTRHMRGTFDDVTGMLTGFMKNNEAVKVMMKESVRDYGKC